MSAALPFRVWHIPNLPGPAFRYQCISLEEAQGIATAIAMYDLFLGDLIESNAQGIERWEDGEWSEYDEMGDSE